MQVKKGLLPNIVDFLHEMKIEDNPKGSVGRKKIKDTVNEHFKEYSEDQVNIIDEFGAWTDEEKGQYTPSPKLNEALNELNNQKLEVAIKTPFKKDFAEEIENYSGELAGTNGDIHALFYEKFVGEEVENENT